MKKIVLLTGITLAVYLAMKYILPVAIPFLLGGLMAMLLNPAVQKVSDKTGKGRGMISLVIFTLALAVTGAVCYVIGRTLCVQLTVLVKNADSIQEDAAGFWNDCCSRLEQGFGIRITKADMIFAKMENKIRSGMQTAALPFLLKNSVTYAKAVFSIMGVVLVSFISGLLILTDFPKIAQMAGSSQTGRLVMQIKQHAKEAGGTYLKAQIAILLIISLICVAGLFVTGNPYALLAGMGIGLCDALPFVGTGMVFVPWMLIDILNGRYILAAIYAFLYLICSIARQFLEPRLIGERLGYPPIIVLMSLYIGVHVYGASGVLLGPVSLFLIYELYIAADHHNSPADDGRA